MTRTHQQPADGGRVRIPADVDRPDRILAGLTARQLLILTTPALALWVFYLAVRRWVPLPVFAALATPVAVGAAVLALGQRDGISLDRLLLAAVGHARSPRRLVPAPDGIPTLPSWTGHDAGPRPAPLQLPVVGMSAGGGLDLGADGTAVVCAVAPVNFALRTPTEQQALIAGFARYLNSLTTPVQILIRATPLDLTPTVTALREAAGGLPHPALEAAARDHADYLRQLAGSRDLLSRQVLLILRDPTTASTRVGSVRGGEMADGSRVGRLAAEAVTGLAGCGLTVTPLDATAVSVVLASALDPWAPPQPAGMAPAGAVISSTVGAERGWWA